MKSWMACLALALATAVAGCATSQIGSGRSSCGSGKVVQFSHLSELPPQAVGAVGGLAMADAGEPMNKTDIVIAGDPVLSAPMQRFIDAEQRGCRLVIHYEQGGTGYSRGQIVLRQTTQGWRVERAPQTIPVR